MCHAKLSLEGKPLEEHHAALSISLSPLKVNEMFSANAFVFMSVKCS